MRVQTFRIEAKAIWPDGPPRKSAFQDIKGYGTVPFMDSFPHLESLLPELHAYARAICQREENAEDLVQDAIERAVRSEHRPAKRNELRPWMFRVIRNLRYDELRRRRVRREYLAAEKRLLDVNDGHSDTARNVLIRLAYEKLQPEAREVLLLVDILGLKYAEAATVMDVPVGTVMSRISRARRALLAIVDDKAFPAKRVIRKR